MNTYATLLSATHVARLGLVRGLLQCGCLFRDSCVVALGSFALNLSIVSAFESELTAVMIAIHIAFDKGWMNSCLECDSSLMVVVFSDPSLVLWKLQSRWRIYLYLFSKCLSFALIFLGRVIVVPIA